MRSVGNEVAATPPVTTADLVRRTLMGRRRDVRGSVFEGALFLALLISLTILVILLVDVFSDGFAVLRSRGVQFLTSGLSSIPERAGVRQGIMGSLLLMMFVVALSFPLGIGAAVYLEEYARDNWLTRIINANIRNLAGVPSIVYGLLGVAIFVQLTALSRITGGRSVISGGLTMAILVLPIVVITSAEALRAVPQSIREAGYGVGATRWEVIRSHVLPYAAPGIFTGTILTLARAFGETAPLIMVGAATGFLSTGSGNFVDQLQGPYTSLPTLVFTFARRSQRAFGPVTAATIVVMLVILLAVNATAIALRNRYERKW
jgi:phosphate transport system permease protein